MIDRRWDKLHDLIDAFLEGELSQQEAERLAVWLSIDDEAQSIYLRALQLHAELTLTFSGASPATVAPSPAAGSCQLTQLSDELCGDLGRVISAAVEGERTADSDERRERVTIGRRVAILARNTIFVGCALMFAVMAVFGSERLITEVLLAPRSTTADQSGGMLAATADEGVQRLYRGPNVDRGTRRVGSGRDEGVALANVFLFPLPRLEDLERVESARIMWTYKAQDNDPEFSVDLYGLGFVPQPGSLERLDFWEGPMDTSLRSAYRMAGASDRRVALIQRGAMTPRTSLGRVTIENRKLVRFLQSLYDDGAEAGDFAVFRLNADSPTSQITRETGYSVVHPPARPGLTRQNELPALVLTASSRRHDDEQVLAQAVMSAHSVSAHWSGGLVRSFNSRVQPGCNTAGTRRVGSSASEGVGLANVFVFSLPSVERIEDIVSARLVWTCVAKDNAPEFSVDLYGLGYTRGESYHGPCFWEGPPDRASPVDYMLEGQPERRVALIARGAMSPATVCGRVVVENQALLEFLRSLYEDGAQEGDLAVFRLNADVSTLNIERATGYAVVHPPDIPDKTTPADLPVLLMTFD